MLAPVAGETANRTSPLQELLRSPLADSNRRPPPYHPITFCLQFSPSRCVADARACPPMPKLMYPSRTRGALSVCKTDNRDF